MSFRAKLGTDFGCYAGATDGILVWIHNNPTKKCCEEAGCANHGKFYCGQKRKFGLNCQAVCDLRVLLGLVACFCIQAALWTVLHLKTWLIGQRVVPLWRQCLP